MSWWIVRWWVREWERLVKKYTVRACVDRIVSGTHAPLVITLFFGEDGQRGQRGGCAV